MELSLARKVIVPVGAVCAPAAVTVAVNWTVSVKEILAGFAVRVVVVAGPLVHPVTRRHRSTEPSPVVWS